MIKRIISSVFSFSKNAIIDIIENQDEFLEKYESKVQSSAQSSSTEGLQHRIDVIRNKDDLSKKDEIDLRVIQNELRRR